MHKVWDQWSLKNIDDEDWTNEGLSTPKKKRLPLRKAFVRGSIDTQHSHTQLAATIHVGS